MTAKSPHLHREANLIQMLDPMSTDWNQALPAPNTTVTSKLVAALDFSRLNTLFENFLQVMNVPIALIDLQGKVKIVSEYGQMLETQQLYYDQKNAWFFTERKYKFSSPKGVSNGQGIDFSKDFKVINSQRITGEVDSAD